MTKICNSCDEEKSLSEYYTQNKTKADGTKYVYYNPECKLCTRERATKWGEDNKERKKEHWRKHSALPHKRELQKRFAKKAREDGRYRDWQRNNKDKAREYRLYREAHKKHEISNQEWEDCKNYFNNECAYCGISNKEARRIYRNYLHKDHADHQGTNDLSNCIPACKSCNGSKHNFNLVEWYAGKDYFSQGRLSKIQKWLESDYMNYIEEKKIS